MADDELTQKPAYEILRDSDRDSVGVLRLTSDAGKRGKAGAEVEYQAGDEALVEAGQAVWVVAPVHLPSAGRRLDLDASKEPYPADGIEVFPPAEPTTGDRRAKARAEGYVEAHSDKGAGEKLAAARAKASDDASNVAGDAKTQAALGGSGARDVNPEGAKK